MFLRDNSSSFSTSASSLCYNPHITPIPIQKCKSHFIQQNTDWICIKCLVSCIGFVIQFERPVTTEVSFLSSKCCYLRIPCSSRRETVDWRIALNMSVSADRRAESNYKANQFRQGSIHSRALTHVQTPIHPHTQSRSRDLQMAAWLKHSFFKKGGLIWGIAGLKHSLKSLIK